MPETERINLENETLWKVFEQMFIYDRGNHLLGLGQTNTGKTQKAYQFVEWLIQRGETIAWFDCGKSGEILPLFNLGFPIHIISPANCDVLLNGISTPVTFDHAMDPGKTWDLIKPGYINILSFRAFFRELSSYGAYINQVLVALENLAYDGKSTIPRPISLFIDEFGEIAPSGNLQANRYMRENASRSAMFLKRSRSAGIRVCAFDQSWTDVFPNARRQFPFLLICRSPNLHGTDCRSLERYSPIFDKLETEEGLIVFPDRHWHGHWHFPLFKRPAGSSVDYPGQPFIARSKPRVERWERVIQDEGIEVTTL